MVVRILSLLIIFLSACSYSHKVKYEYLDGLRSYLLYEHQISVDTVENTIFYITPLDGCDYCVRQNLLLLQRTSNKSIFPILVDKTTNEETLQLFDNLIEKYPHLRVDKKGKVLIYETGYFKPILVHIKKGVVVEYFYIEDQVIPIVEKYLRKNM